MSFQTLHATIRPWNLGLTFNHAKYAEYARCANINFHRLLMINKSETVLEGIQ